MCPRHLRSRGDVRPVRTRAQTTAAKQERAILVGAERPRMLLPVTESLAELARLTDTAGLVGAGQTVQPLRRIPPATFVGARKVDEIHAPRRYQLGDVPIVDPAAQPPQARH